MQKAFSREEVKLNNAITEVLEWTINEDGEYLMNNFPIFVNGKRLIQMKQKMYFLNNDFLEKNVVFRPMRNLKHTYFLTDFLYENEIVDTIIKDKNEEGIIKCVAIQDDDEIECSIQENEAEARSSLFLYLEAFDMNKEEIDKNIKRMQEFNLKGQQRIQELKEKRIQEEKERKKQERLKNK